jgi:hypothetical protein
MRRKQLVYGIFLLNIVIVFALSGCGKNSMGPSTPTLQNYPQQVFSSEPEGDFQVACKEQEHYWPQRERGRILGFLTEPMIEFIANYLTSRYMTFPEFKINLHRVIETRLFRIVVFRMGVGQMIMKKFLRIVSQTWAPGWGTNPMNFNYEISLLPYDFSFARGFHGLFHPGWGNGNGYHLESFAANGDRVIVQSKTAITNIYQNQTNVQDIEWFYQYVPTVYDPSTNRTAKGARISFNYAPYSHRFGFSYQTNLDENADTISLFDVSASCIDQSANVSVGSSQGKLNIQMTFNAQGIGSGTLDILNSHGFIDHYEIVTTSYDHGYWTKNGNPRNRF